MKIKYEFVNGDISEVEVEDSLGALLVDMDRQEYNINHKETRRHVLLSAIDPADRYLTAETDLLQDLIDEEDHERLMAAIAKLQPQQRELLYRVYWNGEKQKDNEYGSGAADDVAEHFCIERASAYRRKNRASERLTVLLFGKA